MPIWPNCREPNEQKTDLKKCHCIVQFCTNMDRLEAESDTPGLVMENILVFRRDMSMRRLIGSNYPHPLLAHV